jgi:hypothetical protein
MRSRNQGRGISKAGSGSHSCMNWNQSRRLLHSWMACGWMLQNELPHNSSSRLFDGRPGKTSLCGEGNEKKHVLQCAPER